MRLINLGSQWKLIMHQITIGLFNNKNDAIAYGWKMVGGKC